MSAIFKNSVMYTSGGIDKTVNDLVYYYTKSQTYSQAEVNALVSAIPKMDIEVVESLLTIDDPNTHTIYLVPSGSETGNLYTEYIYLIDETTSQGSFEKLGTQTLNLAYSNAYLTGVTNVQDALDALVNIDKKDFWLSATKGINDTSVTFSDQRITANSIYEIYTDDINLMYTSTTLSAGSVVVTFDSTYTHQNSISVKLYVHNP